jgi:transcriptional regulator with XRE-family HTH domain
MSGSQRNEVTELARRLRNARTESGLSQAQAAAATRLSRVAIAEIEAGRRKVSSLELAALAKAYAQNIAVLVGDIIAEDEYGSPVVSYLARTAKQLAPNDQEQLLRFAEYLRAESKKRLESQKK